MHFSMVGTISFDVPGKELKITQSWPAFSTFDLIFLHGDAFPWVNSYTSENVNILLGKPCFRWLDFGIIEHHVRSLLSLCDMLLEYSFEPRPNIRALGTMWYSRLCYEHCFIDKRMLAYKTQFDERKQDWLVQNFGLLRPQRLDKV